MDHRLGIRSPPMLFRKLKIRKFTVWLSSLIIGLTALSHECRLWFKSEASGKFGILADT